MGSSYLDKAPLTHAAWHKKTACSENLANPDSDQTNSIGLQCQAECCYEQKELKHNHVTVHS